MAYLKDDGKTIVIDGKCLVDGCTNDVDPDDDLNIQCKDHREQMRKNTRWMGSREYYQQHKDDHYEPNAGGC